MNIPIDAGICMDALEAAGFPTYAVGGCVRDQLLGLQPHDYDLCTAATPEQMRQIFRHRLLVLAGEKHGTIGVVANGDVVEITTFRTEGGYADCRHPGWVKFVPTIEEDLARRDFTVNAMAWSPTRGFADPFGGQNDLKNGILRAVGCPELRFQEDSLRILRGVRFAVKYRLTPESATEKAMVSQAPLMDGLARERVFDELCKLLLLVDADDLLRYAPILTQVIPELGPAVGFDQCNPHHAYDLFTHTAHVTAAVPNDLALRWAALLHDVGKVSTFSRDENGRGHFIGHAKAGAEIANRILLRLKAPTALRERVVLLVEQHMTPFQPDKRLLRRRLSKLGQEVTEQLLMLQEADFCSKGVVHSREDTAEFEQIWQCLAAILDEEPCLTVKDLAIDGHDLMALGYEPGKAMGQCLNSLLEQVLDGLLPNIRESLLHAVKSMRE